MPISWQYASKNINILKSISDKMRIKRSERKLSQQEAAAEVGISRYYWGEIETGKKEPGKRLEREIERWIGSDVLSVPGKNRLKETEKSRMIGIGLDEATPRYGTDKKDEIFEESMARLGEVARSAGLTTEMVLAGLVKAAERKMKEEGGLVFPLQLSSGARQSTAAGENER
ncbi:MAG: helix-turn-helix transcriptional regulator [Akkermansiaceae bacterium]